MWNRDSNALEKHQISLLNYNISTSGTIKPWHWKIPSLQKKNSWKVKLLSWEETWLLRKKLCVTRSIFSKNIAKKQLNFRGLLASFCPQLVDLCFRGFPPDRPCRGIHPTPTLPRICSTLIVQHANTSGPLHPPMPPICGQLLCSHSITKLLNKDETRWDM